MALYSPHVLDYINLHSILNLVNTITHASALTTVVLLHFANNIPQAVCMKDQENCILSQTLEACASRQLSYTKVL